MEDFSPSEIPQQLLRARLCLKQKWNKTYIFSSDVSTFGVAINEGWANPSVVVVVVMVIYKASTPSLVTGKITNNCSFCLVSQERDKTRPD